MKFLLHCRWRHLSFHVEIHVLHKGFMEIYFTLLKHENSTLIYASNFNTTAYIFTHIIFKGRQVKEKSESQTIRALSFVNLPVKTLAWQGFYSNNTTLSMTKRSYIPELYVYKDSYKFILVMNALVSKNDDKWLQVSWCDIYLIKNSIGWG